MDTESGKGHDEQKGLPHRLARVGLALLFPPAPIVAVSPFAIVALLVRIFYLGSEGAPGAYVAYVLTAYALAVVVAAIVKGAMSAPPIEETLDDARKIHPLVARLIDDPLFRSFSVVRLGLAVDLLQAAASLFLAWWHTSLWTFTLAIYYVCLAVMRAFLSHYDRTPHTNPATDDRKICLSCGICIMALAFPVRGIAILNVYGFGTFTHHMYVAIGVALYAFVKLGAGIYNFVHYSDGSMPVRLALSSVSVSSALATMLTMSILMLNDFGDKAAESVTFQLWMTAGMGVAVTLGVFVVGLVLTVRSLKIGRV